MLAAAAVAQVLVPTVGPVLAGTREGADRYDTVITPPGYAFSIWAPIFAASLATAARPRGAVDRTTARWLAGAYALNAGWSVAAQSDRFVVTPALLGASVGSAAAAFRRLQRPDGDAVAAGSTGLLLGWTALAATVNAFAAVRARGGNPVPEVAASAAGGVAAVVAATVAASRRGWLPLAAATAWGLGTTAGDGSRPRVVRAVAAAGAAAVAGAAVFRSRRG
jgi:hypothetical protein